MSRDVLLLSNAYWPSIGGIENSLRHLAEEAQVAGDNVEIIVSDLGLSAEQSGHSEQLVDGVLVTRYPLHPVKNKLLAIFNIIYSNFLLYKLLRTKLQNSPETIVIARFHFAALIASLAGFKKVSYLVPSIFSQQVTIETVESVSWALRLRNCLKTTLHSTVQRIALLRTDVFVFSETMKRQCAELVGQSRVQYTIVKPGVDSRRFFPIEAEGMYKLKMQLQLPVDKPLVLFVGRFVKAKGVDILLNAFAKIDLPCHLVLIGDGDELNFYKETIQRLCVDSDVSIIPPLKEVEKYYRCADIFVMCSSYEPLGQTILEAFASGLPLVAFKNSKLVNTATQELGMNDFITYASSYSDVGLADAISEQLESITTIERKIISDKANANFSWSKLYSSLVEI